DPPRPRRGRRRAPPSHARPVGPAPHRAGAGGGPRPHRARGPGARRDRRRARRDAHPRPGDRGGLRPHRRRRRGDPRPDPARRARARADGDGGPVTAPEALPAAEPAPPSPVGLARPLLSLLVAAVCGGAVVLMARGAVGTASGQRLDQLTLSGSRNHDGLLSRIAELAVETVSMPVIIALLALT